MKTEIEVPRVRVVALRDAAAWERFLTKAESGRAGKIRAEALRARFVISRGLRREMLAQATGRAAGDLEFVEEEGHKPRLVSGDGWDFNVSHAGDHVAVAVGRAAVGIDLEKLRPVREMSALVRRYFHADEARAWEVLDEGVKEKGFFMLWSAREAAMKCCGLGLAKGLAVTRVDPEFLRKGVSTATVGDSVVEVEKLDAPPGYVMVAAKSGRGSGTCDSNRAAGETARGDGEGKSG